MITAVHSAYLVLLCIKKKHKLDNHFIFWMLKLNHLKLYIWQGNNYQYMPIIQQINNTLLRTVLWPSTETAYIKLIYLNSGYRLYIFKSFFVDFQSFTSTCSFFIIDITAILSLLSWLHTYHCMWLLRSFLCRDGTLSHYLKFRKMTLFAWARVPFLQSKTFIFYLPAYTY